MSNESRPDPTMESLRVSSEEFDAVVDRSAGGPAYREVIASQAKLIITMVLVGAAIAVLLVVVLIRFSSILGSLEKSNSNSEAQRVLLLEQTKVLLECTTPSPPPPPAGEPYPKGEDGKHECYEQGDKRGIDLVILIRRSDIALQECIQEKAKDLTKCINQKVPLSGGKP